MPALRYSHLVVGPKLHVGLGWIYFYGHDFAIPLVLTQHEDTSKVQVPSLREMTPEESTSYRG